MEGKELAAALALLLGADLEGARQREGKRRFNVLMAGNLAADVTDQPAEPGAQDAQFPTVAVELLGVGVAPRHHRRMSGDTDVGLPQPHPMPGGQAVEPLDGGVQQLGIGRKLMFLGCTVVSIVTRLRPCSATPRSHAPPAGSRSIAGPVCRRAASSNVSGPSVHAGTHAGRTPRR